MELQLLYQNLLNGRFMPISDKLIPMILNRSGKSAICLAYKNISNYIISSISLTATGIPSGSNLKYALTTSSSIPENADYSSNWALLANNELLNELHPGQAFKLFLKVDFQTNIGIDFADFTIDITYLRSHISLSNLKSYFEFTEEKGSLLTESSYPSVTGSVDNKYIIAGNGYALFRNSGDDITFSLDAATSLSLFIKGIFDINSDDLPLFNMGNFEFGINSARQPYISIDSNRVVATKSLTDYHQEYLLGVSVTDTNTVLFTIDREETFVLSRPESNVDLNLSSGTATVGNNGSKQFRGDLYSLAIYSDFKNLSFHSSMV